MANTDSIADFTAFAGLFRFTEVSEVSRRGHSHVCRAQAKAAKAKGGKGGSSQALPKKPHKIE
jgi:phage terminase large subunit-like protein